jgi:ATP-binding cassette subfamily B multidrug efflux pump
MWESLRTVRGYLWRYRAGLGLGLGALVLKDVAGAVQPLVIRAAIDTLSQAFGVSRLLRFAALLVGLAAVKGLFQYWMRVIIIGISRDIEYDLRNDLFRHLVDLSPD